MQILGAFVTTSKITGKKTKIKYVTTKTYLFLQTVGQAPTKCLTEFTKEF